jgi:hypothetical protein
MFLPDDLVERLSKKYKPSSIKVHAGNIKRVFKLAGKQKFNAVFLANVSSIKQLLEKDVKLSTRKNIVNSIIAVCQHFDLLKLVVSRYDDYFKQLARKHNNNYKYRKATKKEKANELKWEELIAIRTEYDNEIKRDALDEMLERERHEFILSWQLLHLYTELPALRGGEYLSMKLVELKGNEDVETLCATSKVNLCDLGGRRLLVCDHKTVDKYGIKEITLPTATAKLVEKAHTLLTVPNEGIWLFPHPTLPRALTNVELNKLMKLIFSPRNVGTQMLRKIYIGHFLNGHPSADERKRVSAIMGHSLEMQEFVYSRFRKGNDD